LTRSGPYFPSRLCACASVRLKEESVHRPNDHVRNRPLHSYALRCTLYKHQTHDITWRVSNPSRLLYAVPLYPYPSLSCNLRLTVTPKAAVRRRGSYRGSQSTQRRATREAQSSYTLQSGTAAPSQCTDLCTYTYALRLMLCVLYPTRCPLCASRFALCSLLSFVSRTHSPGENRPSPHARRPFVQRGF
jgi:hypothetical protein